MQSMGPLEIKVDAMLKKLSLLERMDQLLQKWEHPKKVSNPEEKKDIDTNLRGPRDSLAAAPHEESSMGKKSPQQRGLTTYSILEEIPHRHCCRKHNREAELKR